MSAIKLNNKTIIHSMVQALHGNQQIESYRRLRSDLLKFNRLNPFVSKEAIKKWFEHEIAIRKSHYRHLIRFINEQNSIDAREYNRITEFLNLHLEEDKQRTRQPIKIKNTNVIIDLSFPDGEVKALSRLKRLKNSILKESDQIIFITYRYKFGYQTNDLNQKPNLSIAKEVLIIENSSDKSCTFKHYFRELADENKETFCIEGVMLPNRSRDLWLLGFCTAEEDFANGQRGRMRCLQIHDLGYSHEIHSKVRGGIMMSDSHKSKIYEPSATKCLLFEGQSMSQDNACMSEYIKSNTLFISKETFKQEMRDKFSGLDDQEQHVENCCLYIENAHLFDKQNYQIQDINESPMIAELKPIEDIALTLAKKR